MVIFISLIGMDKDLYKLIMERPYLIYNSKKMNLKIVIMILMTTVILVKIVIMENKIKKSNKNNKLKKVINLIIVTLYLMMITMKMMMIDFYNYKFKITYKKFSLIYLLKCELYII